MSITIGNGSPAEIHRASISSMRGCESFEFAPGFEVEAGEYDDEELQLVLITDDSQPLSMRMTAKIGGYFGGDRVQMTPAINYRVGETFNADWAGPSMS